AKFRAARRVWARIMKERFGATKAESMRLRFHCQTAAATLTRAPPMNNVVRTALQALSAVPGGAQSLHTKGLDEAYALPSEEPAAAAPDMPIHKVPPETEARQVARLRAVRARRDEREVARLMDGLAEAASDPAANLMEPTIALVRARASMGEIVNRLRNIWGTYVEKPVF